MMTEMLLTAESAGLKIISDDLCCKLLAVTFFYTNEDIVFNEKLRAHVMAAAKRAGLYGGGIPNPEMLKEVNRLVRELRAGRPDWLSDIETKYGTQFYAESGLYDNSEGEGDDIRLYPRLHRQTDSGEPAERNQRGGVSD